MRAADASSDAAAGQRAERTEGKGSDRSGEGRKARSLRGSRSECEHRDQDVAEAEHQQPHESEAAEQHVSERDGCLVVKNSELVIEGKRDTKTGKPDERGQRRPAMGRNDR